MVRYNAYGVTHHERIKEPIRPECEQSERIEGSFHFLLIFSNSQFLHQSDSATYQPATLF